MKFSCDKSLLANAVNKVVKIPPTKSSNQVLEGICLNLFEDGTLKLTAYDTTIGIETFVQTECGEPGSLVLNAKLFNDILNNIPNGDITLTTQSNDTVKIINNLLDFTLSYIDGDNYPIIPVVDQNEQITIKQKTLVNMIKMTSATIIQTEMNPVLKGVLIKLDEGSIKFVSSDTYRLSYCQTTVDYKNKTGNDINVIIPGRTLNELIKILDSSNDEEDIVISFSDKNCSFETESFRMYSSLIRGEFINYKKITPVTYKNVIKIRREDFANSISRASLLVGADKSTIPVRLDFEFDHVIISFFKDMGHRYTDEIQIEKEGENFEIGFNNKHLLSILNSIDDEYILFEANSSLSPACIKPIEGESYYYLVSPMRLNKN